MRRGMGGRGRGAPRGGGAFGLHNNGGRLPFDLTYCSEIFPRVGAEPDDSALTTALLKRNSEITPSTEETQATQNLVTRVQGILENLILTPGTFDACQVDEIRQVGSFKHGTILAGHKTADFVVILKTLPTKEGVEALHVRVSDELKQTDCVRSNSTPRGFDLSSVDSTVRVMVTTIPPNMKKLDPNLHLDSRHMNEHWQAIRHSRWFEENAQQSTIKVLIRILRDIRIRFAPFQPLQPYMLDLLAHYATMNNPTRHPLPINAAFRRSMGIMSGGMYLPGFAGAGQRGHGLTFEDMDGLTAAAQTLVLVMGQGGFEAVLGIADRGDILNVPTVWDGIVVSPHERVYDKSQGQEIEVEEEIEGEA